MEKENKYYTPSADEFYIGFEYEYKFIEHNNDNWYLVNFGDTIDTLRNLDDEKVLHRVKYLDQEDLESLGWKYIKINDYVYSGDGSSMIFELTNNEYSKWQLLLFENYNEVWIDFIHEATEKKLSYFKGKIKNKNELKKLMKQLNII
jgi:hypothetical protein